jgi:SAM-dependent methyltransferase
VTVLARLRHQAARARAEGIEIDIEIRANPCALCRVVDGARPLFEVDRALIVRCSSCRLVRQATRPTSPSELYDGTYYSTSDPKGGYANYFLDAIVNRKTFADRLRLIERRFGRRGRLLDVGCALGDFLIEAERVGWLAEGVEVSDFAAAHARDRGLRVHAGELERSGLADASYDVITLYDTIEHLQDPVGTLREIRRVLAPGGLLHLVTPNVASLQARLLGRRWYHYKPGEHLYYFSPLTLRRAIEAAGLSWEGWAVSASHVTVAYVLNRMRYYARGPFGRLERLARRLPLASMAFPIDAGEMQAWAARPPV